MSAARLQVDLSAFAENVATARARVAPAELMLVVKDDAYGHGIDAVVARAVAEDVRWFGAFDVRAAIATRAVSGPRPRIFSWLTVGAAEIAAALDADVDLGVGDAGFLDDVAAVAAAQHRAARVHLKIDTGLHRNGIRPEDWPAVLARAKGYEDAGLISVVGIWSHIAEASDEEDDLSRAAFDTAVAAATSAGFEIEVRHLAASAASFARPEFRYDLVRIGAFCYGIRPAGGPGDDELGIRPIATLTAPVVSADGDAVTIAIGSLDGLPSPLAGRVSVATPHGRRPLIEIGPTESRVEAWPGARADHEVIVFGADGPSATDLAETIETVGEELLVRVSPTVPRVVSGEKPTG
ncbi:MAG TPA: alanine racemase [Microbacterium sp.]|uniref:alanine racemase n=1 Tax=Microbacterium sp. TaxID=51671 RepID=UPI002C07317E|nr:alanine racemase [Microbacterium sp.]HWI32008.1 alanine racemase [Microbacterium sp.]